MGGGEAAHASWSSQEGLQMLLGSREDYEQGNPVVLVKCNAAGLTDGTWPLAWVESEGADVPKGSCAVIASEHRQKDMDHMVAAFSQRGNLTTSWGKTSVDGKIEASMTVTAMNLKTYPANGTMTGSFWLVNPGSEPAVVV